MFKLFVSKYLSGVPVNYSWISYGTFHYKQAFKPCFLMMTEFTKRYDVDYDALACCSVFMLLPMKVN